jgi:hypothetical protein
LQSKAHSKARTWNGKPDLKGNALTENQEIIISIGKTTINKNRNQMKIKD